MGDTPGSKPEIYRGKSRYKGERVVGAKKPKIAVAEDETLAPKKSLGQNFLRDERVLARILENIPKDVKCVLEVGPGEGALTRELLQAGYSVVAVELDDRAVVLLRNRFAAEAKLGFTLIHGDILDLTTQKSVQEALIYQCARIAREAKKEIAGKGLRVKGEEVETPDTDVLSSTINPVPLTGGLPPAVSGVSYQVVANIPYYITAPIIRSLITYAPQPKSITLMVQDEVAERLTAPVGELSILGIMAQLYTRATYLFQVSRRAFYPIPNVDSAIIQLVPIRAYDHDFDKQFFGMIRGAFAAKRKTLINNLSNMWHSDRAEATRILDTLELSPEIRAQEVSVEQWQQIWKLHTEGRQGGISESKEA